MSTNLKLLSIIALFLIQVISAKGQVRFIRQNSIYKPDNNTRSLIPGGILDINGDLIDDLVILDRGKTIKIALSNGFGEPFTFLTGPTVNNNEEWTLTAGDLNNDGKSEIISAGALGVVNITSFNGKEFNLVKTGGGFYAQGSNVVDINNDGFADYFVCDDNGPSKIFMNDGTGKLTLTQVIDFSTTPASDMSGNYGSEWIDVNKDLLPDLFIAKCRAGVDDPEDPRRINVLYLNNGDGTFTERASDFKMNSGEQSWVVTFGDIDNDGDLDAFEANHYGPHRVLENIDGTHFEPVGFMSGPLSSFAFQAVMRDFDNDGFLDIAVSGVEGLYFLYNNGDKTFRKVDGPITYRSISSMTLGDINDDGFIDIHAHHARPINVIGFVDDDLLINEGNDNNHVRFNLEGTVSNRSGIGARIEIYGDWGMQMRYVKGGESYGIINSLQQHFGLSKAMVVDSVLVYWPSGVVQKHTNLPVNQTYLIKENGCITTSLRWYEESVDYFNQPLELSAPEGYAHYVWSTGDTLSSITINSPGIYRLTLTDDNGCITIVKPVKVVNKCFTDDTDLLPYPPYYEVCGNTSVTINAADADNYLWNSNATTQSLEISQSGWFVLEATDKCGHTLKDSVEVNFRNFEYQLQGDTIQKGATATLVSDIENTTWYDSEDASFPVHTGPVFQTEILNFTTYFFAVMQFLLSSKEGRVGETTFPVGNEYSSNAIAGNMVFDVHSECVIKSVLLKTDLPGSRHIIIKNSSGDIVVSKIVPLNSGENRVALHAKLNAGENYIIETDQNYNLQQLGFRSPRLVRTFQNTKYPYKIENAVTLLSSSTGPSYFYYFYDWEVSYDMEYCASSPIRVEVYVDESSASGDIDRSFLPSIYPNPSDRYIYFTEGLNLAEKSVSISDQNGKMIFSNLTVQRGEGIFIGNLNPGIYLVQVKTNETHHIFKFIKN